MSASVFPARAGMSLSTTENAESVDGVPRASGDEPAHIFGTGGVVECSPRERG